MTFIWIQWLNTVDDMLWIASKNIQLFGQKRLKNLQGANMKIKTEIKIYLSYTFNSEEQEEAIQHFLESKGLKDLKYEKRKQVIKLLNRQSLLSLQGAQMM